MNQGSTPKSVNFFQRLFEFVKSQLILVVGLLLELALRFPTFFDPYWYGDEAIYLTVGNGIAKGLKLYTEIIDHKTPLIYYLATVPNQFYFRLLMSIWMLVTVVALDGLLKRITSSKLARVVGLWFFVILTGIPWFEGHIPNGELFVMGFVLVGLWILTKTNYLNHLLNHDQHKSTSKDLLGLVMAGFLFGLGILTKVPAILDLGGVLLIGWFAFFQQTISSLIKLNLKQVISNLKTIQPSLIIFGGATLAILLSIIFFVSQGSGRDYLDYGLLYNFRYSGSWKLNLNPSWLNLLFTLPVKTLLLGGWIVFLSICTKLLSPKTQWSLGWFGLALYATLLSNRPYPHYYQQLMPALAILLASNVDSIITLIKSLSVKSPKKQMRETSLGLVLSGVAVGLWIAILVLMKVGIYPVSEYYAQFNRFYRHEISQTEYNHSFNWLIAENDRLAKMIDLLNADRIFIWGTDPMLYALTKTIPTSRFTVSFHVRLTILVLPQRMQGVSILRRNLF